MKDYYQVLGVDKSANDQDIKSAFRKLAMNHHPDRGGDIAKFQEIQEAYQVLSDPQKRAEYDNPQPQFYHQNAGGGTTFDFGGTPFEEIFGQGHPFGDFFGFRRRSPINQNIQLQTSITLEDAFNGKEVLASLTLPSGREQTINIKIPAGIHNGTTLKLSGMGDDSLPGIPRGDILLTIQVQDHHKFKRQGDDLICDVEVTTIAAMLGTEVIVETIDQRQLQTEIPSGIQHDSLLSLVGQGMPNFNDPSRRGRLLIRIKLTVPELSEIQKDALRKLNII